jgi:hypothetical protein
MTQLKKKLTYCNELEGSISQWSFIALQKVSTLQLNTASNSSNTRTTSTRSLTQLLITINSAPNNVRALQALSHNSQITTGASNLFKSQTTTTPFIRNLSLIYHTAISV